MDLSPQLSLVHRATRTRQSSAPSAAHSSVCSVTSTNEFNPCQNPFHSPRVNSKDKMTEMEPNTVALLRESKNRWERRTALTPSNVKELVGHGIRVLVQPSTLRVVSTHFL